MFFSTTKVQLVAYRYFACKIATGMWFLHTHPHFGPEFISITLLRNDICIPQLWPVNNEENPVLVDRPISKPVLHGMSSGLWQKLVASNRNIIYLTGANAGNGWVAGGCWDDYY